MFIRNITIQAKQQKALLTEDKTLFVNRVRDNIKINKKTNGPYQKRQEELRNKTRNKSVEVLAT